MLMRHRTESPEALTALAHPVRLDLLDLLALHGPLTASEAARRLDQTAANISWHLRKLGQYGFVRQAMSGPGRRRPWKLVAEAVSASEPDVDSGPESALAEVVVDRERQRLRRALSSRATESAPWRAVIGVRTTTTWLTADEARRLTDEIDRLVHAAVRRSDGQRPDDARPVSLVGWLIPAE